VVNPGLSSWPFAKRHGVLTQPQEFSVRSLTYRGVSAYFSFSFYFARDGRNPRLLNPNTRDHPPSQMDNAAQHRNPFLGAANSSYGTFNSTHSSTVSIHYPEGKLITPWPVLLASLILSFVLSLIGYTSAASDLKKYKQDKLPARSTHKTLLALGGLLITTIRLIFLIAFVVRGQKTTGSPSPSSLLLFLISMLPYNRNVLLPKWLNWTALVEFLVGFVVMCWLFFHTVLKMAPGEYGIDGFGYAQLAVTGGNCPYALVNTTCADMKSVISYSGCSNQTAAAPDIAIISITEAFFEILGVLVVAIALLSYCIRTSKERYERVAKRGGMEPRRAGRQMTYGERRAWKWFIRSAVLVIGLSVITTSIVVPEHAVAEASPKTYYILDSFGPYDFWEANSSYHGNSSSWTDCFEMRPPSDKFGFASFWWQNEESRALRVLSGL
jgi:hypothetical protein